MNTESKIIFKSLIIMALAIILTFFASKLRGESLPVTISPSYQDEGVEIKKSNAEDDCTTQFQINCENGREKINMYHFKN